MTQRFLFLTLLGALFIFGCAKETIDSGQNVDLSEIEAAMDEISNEIEQVHLQADIASDEASSRGIITVPAGSNDAIMAAVKAAGHGGTVILESGMHFESAPLFFDKPVKLKGKPGAIVEINVAEQDPSIFPWPVNPAIHIKGVGLAKIEGIEVRPKNDNGSAAILLENAPSARIQNNTFKNFFNGIFIYKSNGVRITNNHVIGYSDSVWGITVIEGNYSKIDGNEVESYAVGLYASDKKGEMKENDVHENSIGILLCTVPAWIVHPDGTLMKAPDAANKWVIKGNTADNNTWAYLVIDGAYRNFVFQNAASNSSLYDIECAGETSRFGFPAPTSSNNKVVSLGQYRNLVVKDCGINNTMYGGKLVNNNEDPCF